MNYRILLFSLLLAFGSNAQLPNGSVAPDFTLTDINGNTHNLYTYLDQGKVVYLEIFACHCPSCWAFHNTGKLESLYQMYGPGGTDKIVVFMVEYDENNGMAEFYGTGGFTQGDWVTGTSFPMFNPEGSDRSVLSDYNVSFYPVLYRICPDKTLEAVATSTSVADMYQKADDCPGTLGLDANPSENFELSIHDRTLLVSDYTQVKSIEVVNLQGQSVRHFETLNSSSIELNDLNPGIYLVRANYTTGTVVRKFYLK